MTGGDPDELVSVRLIVDRPPIQVAQAVARALLLGQPGYLVSWPTDGFPLPWPVCPEWEGISGGTLQFQPERVWAGSRTAEQQSVSLGLRPLFPGEGCSLRAVADEGVGFQIDLKTCASSTVIASEIEEGTSGKGKRGNGHFQRSFSVRVSSSWIDEAVRARSNRSSMASNSEGKAGKQCADPSAEETARLHAALAHDASSPPSWITTLCQVLEVAGGRRAEIKRQLLDGSPLVKAASGAAMAHPAFSVASTIAFMLEMETRAWLDLHKLPLVEVWRGIRRVEPWAIFPGLSTVASYTFGPGHAGFSANERLEGPRFNVTLALRLERQLPNVSAGKACGGRQYTEGNVCVESFARLLDRVCRRASAQADIFRKFVDLGSGRGHAVIAAHALHPFRLCVGYELVPDVFEAARAAAKTYQQSGLAFHAQAAGDPAKMFVMGDFLHDLSWTTGSVVFANAVTYPKDVIRSLATLALRLQPGAVLLMAARQLPTDDPALLEAFDVRGEAVLMGFSKDAVRLWAYQRR